MNYRSPRMRSLARLAAAGTCLWLGSAFLEALPGTRSPEEILALRRASRASTGALRAAMRAVRPGYTPREIQAEGIKGCILNGAQEAAFSPHLQSTSGSLAVAESGSGSQALLDRPLQAGERVSLRVGCSHQGYPSSVARTVPVGDEFSEAEQETWSLLARAYRNARRAIRPGATPAQVRSAYATSLEQTDAESELARAVIRVSLQEAHSGRQPQLHAVGKELMEELPSSFQAGLVLSMQIRALVPEQRLELQLGDMFLVTEKGTELLSAGLPSSPDEVESFMATPGYTPYVMADIHNHLDPLPRHGLENLIRLMNIHGIAKSIIFRGREKDSEYVLKAVAQYPDRLIASYRPNVYEIPEAWLNNDPAVLAELEQALSWGKFRGIGEVNNVRYPLQKLGPKGGWGRVLLATEVSPSAPMMISMFRLADKHALFVNIHNEVYYYRELMALLQQFPRVQVLWSHGGGVDFYGLEMALANHPNLFIDLSGRLYYDRDSSREDSIFFDRHLIKTGWLELIERYPDRFLVGFDDNSVLYEERPRLVAWMAKLLSQLTPSVARRVAIENMERLLAQ